MPRYGRLKVVGQVAGLGRRRQEVIDQVAHHIDHRLGVKHRARKRVEQHNKWNERKDRVGCHAESKGVHLAVKEIGKQRLPVLAPPEPLALPHGQICNPRHLGGEECFFGFHALKGLNH